MVLSVFVTTAQCAQSRAWLRAPRASGYPFSLCAPGPGPTDEPGRTQRRQEEARGAWEMRMCAHTHTECCSRLVTRRPGLAGTAGAALGSPSGLRVGLGELWLQAGSASRPSRLCIRVGHGVCEWCCGE